MGAGVAFKGRRAELRYRLQGQKMGGINRVGMGVQGQGGDGG